MRITKITLKISVLLLVLTWGLGSSARAWDSDEVVGAYAGYGFGLPTSYGGGVTLARLVGFGYSMTNKSYALTLSATAREHDWAVSPILGYSVSYVSIKANDIKVRGYTDTRHGFMMNMNMGIGFRVVREFYMDMGASFFQGQGFAPFVRVTWPLY